MRYKGWSWKGGGGVKSSRGKWGWKRGKVRCIDKKVNEVVSEKCSIHRFDSWHAKTETYVITYTPRRGCTPINISPT